MRRILTEPGVRIDGSLIIIDIDARTTFAYVANKMEPRPLRDPRPFRIFEAMWQALGYGRRIAPPAVT